MPEICVQCGKRTPLSRGCCNCAFYYEEASVGYAECMNKKMEQVPDDIAQKYMEELVPCPFYEEAVIPGLCADGECDYTGRPIND